MMGDRISHTFPITVDINYAFFSHFRHAMFFMSACVPLFWSQFSHFLESPIWLRTLCLKSILALVSFFVVGILLSQPLVLRILKISLPDIPNSILCSVTALTTYFTVFLAPHGSGFTPGGSLAFFFAQFQKRGCHFCLQLRSSHRGSRGLEKRCLLLSLSHFIIFQKISSFASHHH